MLTTPQLLSFVIALMTLWGNQTFCLQRSVGGAMQLKQVDSSYRQIGSDDLVEEYFC